MHTFRTTLQTPTYHITPNHHTCANACNCRLFRQVHWHQLIFKLFWVTCRRTRRSHPKSMQFTNVNVQMYLYTWPLQGTCCHVQISGTAGTPKPSRIFHETQVATLCTVLAERWPGAFPFNTTVCSKTYFSVPERWCHPPGSTDIGGNTVCLIWKNIWVWHTKQKDTEGFQSTCTQPLIFLSRNVCKIGLQALQFSALHPFLSFHTHMHWPSKPSVNLKSRMLLLWLQHPVHQSRTCRRTIWTYTEVNSCTQESEFRLSPLTAIKDCGVTFFHTNNLLSWVAVFCLQGTLL